MRWNPFWWSILIHKYFHKFYFYFCSITSSSIFHKYSMAWKKECIIKKISPHCALIGKWAYLVHWWYWYMYIFKAIRSTGTIQNFWILTVYRTVSIKRPRLIFFQKSLLNVRYDRKNEGLNILSTRSYNRVVRVKPKNFKQCKVGHSWINESKSPIYSTVRPVIYFFKPV